ncbi:MAG: hypothetical protein OEM02_14845 [Desulfobulbaceae bacterium]|nr:hypothetical protein [Desulfobulbaceae bacterium]
MKKTQLSWFDRLMMNITFAEAGVESPIHAAQPKNSNLQKNCEITNELDNAEESVAPAHI